MSSKVKNTLASSSAALSASNSTPTLSDDAVQAFNEIFAAADVGGVAGGGTDADASKDSNTGDKSDNTSKTASAEKSQKAEENKKSEEVQETESDAEIKAIEAHTIDVNELSQQLGVALQAAALVENVQQKNNFQNVKIVSASDGPKMAGIPSEILRKVDVETLRQQLDLITKNRGILQVEPPVTDGENVDQKMSDEILSNFMLQGPEDGGLDVTVAGSALDISDKAFDQEGGSSLAVYLQSSQEAATAVVENLNFGNSQNQDSNSSLPPVSSPAAVQTMMPAHRFSQAMIDGGDELRIQRPVESAMRDMILIGKDNSARIQLNPETLGKVEIHLEFKNKSVTAEIITENEAAREAVLKHLPIIRAVMQSENLMLENFSARHDQNYFMHENMGQSTHHQHQESGARPYEFSDAEMTGSLSHQVQKEVKKIMAEKSLVSVTV